MTTRLRSHSESEAEVMSGTPEELVRLFYRELLTSLRMGARHIEENDLGRKTAHLRRARALLLEPLGTFNMECDDELSNHLASLYSFFLHEIDEASRTLDARRLDPVIEMVVVLENAWSQVTVSTVQRFKQMARDGKYERPDVIAEIARRMLASGDLG